MTEDLKQNTQDLTTDKLVKDKKMHYMTVIKESVGGPGLERQLNEIGSSAMKKMSEFGKRMQAPVNESLGSLGKDSTLSKLLNEATIKTTELNPNSVTNSKLYKMIPFPPLRKYLLRTYVQEFQSESSKVNAIFDNLNEGKENLLEKMIMLESQYKMLQEVMADVNLEIELAQQLRDELKSQDVESMDESEKQKYNRAENRIARKQRDLETKKAAINQFFISINQTFDVQQLLTDSIDSILDVGPMVLQNAIMLHAAISTQKQVAESAMNVQQTLGQALEANSELINENADNVAELYKNPAIAIESFEKSFSNLIQAVEKTREAQESGTRIADTMRASLSKMNKEMEPVIHDMESGSERGHTIEQSS